MQKHRTHSHFFNICKHIEHIAIDTPKSKNSYLKKPISKKIIVEPRGKGSEIAVNIYLNQ